MKSSRYLLLVVGMLGGCTLGPDYVAPTGEELQLDGGFYDPAGTGYAATDTLADAVSLAAKNWQSIYTDEQLSRLIEDGLANNLDLAAARSNLRAARAAAVVSGADLWPRLDARAEAERERPPSDQGNRNDTYNLFGLLSWELDLWGVNRREAEAGEAEALGAEFSLYDVQVSLIASIAATYFALLDLDKQLDITRAAITTRSEAVRIQSLRKESGVISGLELRQAEVSLAEARRRLPVIAQSRLKTENQLSLLLGRAPDELPRLAATTGLDLPDSIPIGLPSELLMRRPDLRTAEQELIAANARIGVAKGAFFPSITLTGELGFESPELADLLKGGSDYWIVGADLVQPIFNAGSIKANDRIAQERYQQSLLAYQKRVLNALAEVSDGLSAYRLSRMRERTTRQLLEAADDYLRLAKLQYDNGVLGYIDVLDAQRQQLDAELSLSEARRDQLQAVALIYKALGGGWRLEEAAPRQAERHSGTDPDTD